MNDLIDRQAAIDAIVKVFTKSHARGLIIRCIKEVPSAQKRGEWIEKKSMIYCSECANGFDRIYQADYNFCPNCGADMRGDNKNE